MSAQADLRARFVQDARQRLETIRNAAEGLPAGRTAAPGTAPAAEAAAEPPAQQSTEQAAELVRGQAHMIKGAAGMLDFDEVRAAAAELEDAAARRQASAEGAAQAALAAALERLQRAVDAL